MIEPTYEHNNLMKGSLRPISLLRMHLQPIDKVCAPTQTPTIAAQIHFHIFGSY